MVWLQRIHRQTGTALTLLVLFSVLVSGTAVAATRAFAQASQIAASTERYADVATALEPASPARAVRQAYDLLLDNFVTPPPPSELLAAAAGAVARRVAEDLPGEWPLPDLPPDASRDAAWAAFDSWLGRVSDLASATVDRQTIQDAALRGLANAVDEHHTRYLSPKQYEDHQAWRRDDVRYGGIGARLRGPAAVVLEVFAGSPAERAGLRIGDQILEVDHASTDTVPTEAVISRIRGPLGSTVDLLVSRRGVDAPFHVAIERAEIKLAFVRWEPIERGDGHRFGYIQIRGFPEPAIDDKVGQALSDFDRVGIDGLILDFRGNSGGRIDVGLKVASRFLQDGVVYQQLDRGGRLRAVRTIGGFWSKPVPITVLVDGGTASMGEIVASALQESGTARVVGTRTSGNVAGARLFPLSNGGALQITVLQITSGRGSVLNDIGVVPDEPVEMQDDLLLNGVDVQLEAGLRYLTSAVRVIPSAWIPRGLARPEAA